MAESTSGSLTPPSAPCLECGGACVTAEVKVAGGTLRGVGALFVQQPGAAFGDSSSIRTLACTQCGLIRLYATQPEKVLPQS